MRNVLYDSLLGEDEETTSEKEWKGYWRDNPTVNPKMTEAFANE
jgi:hypothetical protein